MVTKLLPALVSTALLAVSSLLHADPGDLDLSFISTLGTGITGENYPSHSPTGAVNAVALQPDGHILVGGNRSRYDNAGELTALKRLNTDGTLDTNFAPSEFYTSGPHESNTSFSSEINVILVNSDGSFYIGGVFDSYGSPAVARTAIAKVNEDGTLDTAFAPPAFSGSLRYVKSLVLDGQGGLLVGGAFTVSGKRNLVRLNATTGELDTSFTATGGAGDLNATVDCVSLGADGRIYVSGANTQGRPLAHRLFGNGARDGSFAVPFANDYGRVNQVLALPDGRVVIGGGYDLAGRPNGDFINGLTSSGALDTAFQTKIGTGTNGWTGGVLKLTPDGRILAAGIFTSFNGTPVSSIVMLAQDGTRDESFAPAPYTTTHNGYLTHFYSVAVQTDGMLVAGGWLDRVSDPDLELRNLVRFNGDSEVAGAGTLKLTAPLGVTTVENAGSVKVQVVRLPGLSGEVTVNYTTGGGSAVAGTHYTTTAGTLTWEDGEGGVKEISIPLTNNAANGGSKTFNVTLSGVTGADLALPAVTQVTILDDEAPPLITTPPANVTTNQGNSFTLGVTYNSVTPVTLQWQFNPGTGFTDIPGAVSASYTVALSNPAAHNGTYRVVVFNSGGSVTSNPATVTVLTPAGSLATGFTSGVINGGITFAQPDASGRTIVISTSSFPANLTLIQRITATGALDASFVQSSLGGTIGGSPTGLVVLPDGRFVVSGYFNNVTSPYPGSAVNRNILARFNADGSFDSAYSPSLPANAGTSVYGTALAPGVNGKFYAGFDNSGGLRRYNADGTLDSGFTAPAEVGSDLQGMVLSVRELSNGKVLVAHRIGRNGQGFTYNLWRLNADGTRDASFISPGANSNIQVIEVLPDGRVAIGGQFTSFSTAPGIAMERVALLDANGALDLSFRSPVPTGGSSNPITQIIHKQGRLLVSGQFTGFTNPALTQGGIARLNLDGTVDSSFVVGAGANNVVNSIFLVGNNQIFAAGAFTQFNGQNVNRAVMLIDPPALGSVGFVPPRITVTEAATEITLTAQRFGPATDAISIDWSTAEVTSGTATAGADFTAANGTLVWAAGDTTSKSIQITLLDDNDLESTETFRVLLGSTNGPVTAASSATITILDSNTPVTFPTQPVGTSLVAGATLSLPAAVSSPTPVSLQWFRNGVPVAGATSANLSLTNITTAGAGLYVLQATNAAGTFFSNTAQVVITQNPASIVGNWPLNLTINAAVRAIVTTPDGGAYIGGDFTNFNGTGRNYLVKVSASGVLDTTFSPTPDGAIFKLALSGDGKLFVLGNITQIGGGAALDNMFGAVDATTGARLGAFMTALGTGADSFNAIRCLTMLSDGDLLLGGDFTSFNNNANHKYLAKLNPDGTQDAAFNTSTATGTPALTVTAVGATPTGGGFVAGGSIGYSGATRFIKFNADGSRDATFAPTVSGSASFSRIRVLADGRVMATGSSLPPGNRTLTLVSATGSYDSAVYSGASNNSLSDFVYQPNGRTIAVGSAAFVRSPSSLGTAGSIASLSTAGVYDGTWYTGSAFAGEVIVAELGLNGEIWLGGDFGAYNTTSVQRLLRIAGNQGDPAIVNPPVTIGVNGGATAQFAVGAIGTNLTYQWFKDGTPLTNIDNVSGATSSILTLSNVTVADDDTYTVSVTGGTPSTMVGSDPVRLNVLGAPVVVTSPGNVTPALGSTISLAAEVLAATPATYVWKRDGVVIQNGGRYSGADTATLVIIGGNNADNGTYTLTVTNALGTDDSTPATVGVSQTAHALDASLSALGVQTAGSTSNVVNALLHLPDGRTLIAGNGGFVGAGGTTAFGNIAVVNAAGQVSNIAAGAFNGSISALHLQPDGKILVAGGFTTINNVSGIGRTRIARLNADLTVDASFVAVGGSNTIARVATDNLGRIYIQGSFFAYDGQNGYSNFVRLSPNGALDLTFSPILGGSILGMRVQSDGKILLVGNLVSHLVGDTLTNINGIVRLLPSGAVDSTFAPSLPASSTVYALDLDTHGRVHLIGFASTVNYFMRRLQTNGATDAGFTFTETLDNQPNCLVVQGNGKVLVGGNFTTPRNRMFRLNSNGTLDTGFNMGTGFTHTTGSPTVNAIALDFLGRIWVGGTRFTSYNGTTANAIAVLQGDGVVLAFTQQPAGQIRDLGATVTFTAAATGSNGIAFEWRKNNVPLTNGGRVSGVTTATLTISDLQLSDAATYTVVVTSDVNTLTSNEALLEVLSTPEILTNPVSLTRDIGGTATFSGSAKGAGTLLYQWFLFDTALVNGTGIAGATTPTLTLTGVDFANAGNYRLRVQNHLGTAFTTTANLRVEKRPGALAAGLPGATTANGAVLAILHLADGSMLIGGQFTTITVNGVANSRSRLARFLADGTLDPAFTPTVPSTVRAIAQDGADRVFIAGDFNGSLTIGGVTATRIRVARLTSALVLDTAFDTSTVGPNANINALAPTENGGVYVGGFFGFNAVGPTAVNRVARLNASGALDTAFSVPTSVVNNEVKALLRRSDGKLYIGGTFGTALVDTAGARDTAFTAFTPFIFVQAQAFLLLDGSLIIGANSTYLRRLNPDTGSNIADYSAGHATQISALARQADGKLLSGSIGPFKRTNPATGLDDTGFANFNSTISALAVDGSGRIWVGGFFSQYGSVSQSNFAILNGGELDSRDGLLTPQTITFDAISNRTFNPAANSFTITAPTSTSGLTVSVVVTSGPATISGNTVTITGAGSVTLTATQAGDATYASASLARTFTVGKADQTINFAALGNRAASSAPFNLNATATSGLAVSYSISGPATLNGNQVTLTGAVGTVVIQATQAGDATWNPAVAVQQSFETTDQPVIPVAQAITWAPPASLFQSQLPFALGGTASSGLPITYTVISGTGSVANGSLTSAINGTLKIRATQAGNSNYLAAAVVEKTITVKADPTTLTLINLSQVYTGTPRPVSILPSGPGTMFYTINKVKGTTAPVNVGTYAVEYVNGSVKKAGSLVITKAPLRVIPDSLRRFVGQDNPAPLPFSYDGFLGSDTSVNSVSKAPVITTTATKTSPGGTYPIKATGGTSANYAFVYVNGTMIVETFAGMYEALLKAPDTAPDDFRPVGKVEITVLANSTGFTGKMTTAKELTAVSFKGNLTPNYGAETATATVSTVLGKAPNTVTYTFELNFELNEDTGIVVKRAQSAGPAQDFGSNLNGRKLQLLTGKPAVLYAGAHTILLTPTAYRTSGVLPLPAGYGYATGVIDAKGKLTVTGALADGTKITAALLPDADAGYRLYLVPYTGRLDSYFATEFLLEAHPDLPGRMYVPGGTQGYEWSKAAKTTDANYKSGFQDTRGSIFFDPWQAPVTKPAVITLRQRLDLNATGDLVIAYDGQPPTLNISGQAFAAAMDATGKVTAEANTRAWKMTVAAATGIFTGSHTATDTNNKPVTVNFTGIMRQPPLAEPSPELIGGGYGITPQLSGQLNGTTSSAIWFE